MSTLNLLAPAAGRSERRGIRRSIRLGSRPSGGVLRRPLVFLMEWQARAEERYTLAEMDERLLRDMGIRREEAVAESRKPFWRI